jgi:glycerol-3-phosphate dehydrogenase
VRPLIAKDNDPTGRNISRGIVLLDHKKRDGLGGFITITGGKLMTYRLMAEMATDLVCEKLHRKSSCSTASLLLPGSGKSEEKSSKNLKRTFVFSPPVRKERAHRFGELAVRMNMDGKNDSSLICECENVTVGEVKFAIRNLDATDLISLRRRTRIGMGTCQGELCSCRAAGLLADNTENILKVREDLRDFLNERWKGIRPISWGDTLRETQFSSWLYNGVCDLGTIKENKTTDI